MASVHLEVHPQLNIRPAPGADLLVLAGDIGSYQKGSRLLQSDFGLSLFSPKLGWPTPVLFVPGNHEYDALDFDDTHLRLREVCERLDITWLERAVVEWPIGGGSAANSDHATSQQVRFVGTTLWSDFDALSDPGTGRANPLAYQLTQRERAFRAANYYLTKMAGQRHGAPMRAEQVREQALVCQAWLRATLNQAFEGSTVVVTHFAPTLGSADPRFGLMPGTAGFCNALDDLLHKADLWLHGHLHCPSDYRRNGCRVVANPLGYALKGEQKSFRSDLLIEVGSGL